MRTGKTAEFRTDAVRIALNSGLSRRQVADDLGVGLSTGDISFIWTREGWLYMAVILDLHSRRVIDWAVSDRGSQYCSHDYQKVLREHECKASVNGKGNCYDNAAVENFLRTIKAELICRRTWETRRLAETAILRYINAFYRARRWHSPLGGKCPLAFERQVA